MPCVLLSDMPGADPVGPRGRDFPKGLGLLGRRAIGCDPYAKNLRGILGGDAFDDLPSLGRR